MRYLTSIQLKLGDHVSCPLDCHKTDRAGARLWDVVDTEGNLSLN